MKTKKTVCALLMLTVPCFAFAKSGAVNYSWGADALATMHDFVVTMMMYVLYICYAVASVLAVISALQPVSVSCVLMYWVILRSCN